MSTFAPITSETVTKALAHRYLPADAPLSGPGTQGIATAELVTRLRSLVGDVPSSLRQQVTTETDGPGPRDLALLASVDDCVKIIFALTRLEPEVEQALRTTLPEVACHLLRHPTLPLRPEPGILNLLDLLVAAMLGWCPGLGRQGDKLLAFLTTTADKLAAGVDDPAPLLEETRTFLGRELGRVQKLEERLIAAETGQLRTQQSRFIAADMINRAMENKQLTRSAAEFLKGPWYESVQLIILTKGVESEQWTRARQITDTLVWTYQPPVGADPDQIAADNQKLYRIVEHLPGEVEELLLALEHDPEAAGEAVAVIQTDHVNLVSGEPLAFEPFDPIAGATRDASRAKVSRVLLRRVKSFAPGQWFTYESDGGVMRIKLVAKLDDVQQLLFTNHNGMKVMQLSFDEFAYLVSSAVARPVGGELIFSSTFRTYYEGLIQEREKQIRRFEERRAEAERQEAAREAARAKALAEAAALARAREDEEQRRIESERRARLEAASAIMAAADPAVIAETSQRVTELAVGAWLRLPDANGELTECKLAVRISATDKMIFVNRTGQRVGEYTSDQLIQLLVAGQGQIQDEGVEFEDTLAEVVSRLRNDRHKSYDDLTGE
ncbi:MAG: DUF1631 family protein [Pseudomonadota bacterium]